MLRVIFNRGLRSLINPATQTRAWLRLIAKRLLRLAVAAALLLIIYNVWNIASLKSQQQLTEHTSKLIEFGLSQVEHQAVNAILSQQLELLAESAAHLQQQPDVMSVVIRSPMGEIMVSEGQYTSVIDWPDDGLPSPWIITRELRQQGETVGYLQVIFDQQALLATSTSAHDGLMQQGRVLLLLAMLAGVFIMLGFNRIRDRFWQRQHSSLQRK